MSHALVSFVQAVKKFALSLNRDDVNGHEFACFCGKKIRASHVKNRQTVG